MNIRKSKDRGYFENQWLKSYHSFSFGEYYEPNNMHFSDLRVINHDFIAASTGFPLHPHKSMEIITYVLRGTVEHQDSMGNKAQVRQGEIQVMGAGTGVVHSEYNPSANEELELMQIWIVPSRPGGDPHYSQRKFSSEEKTGRLLKIISGDGDGQGLPIHQKANIYACVLPVEGNLQAPLNSGKSYWLQVASGAVEVFGLTLLKGDAINWLAGEYKELRAKALQESEFLLFELKSEV